MNPRKQDHQHLSAPTVVVLRGPCLLVTAGLVAIYHMSTTAIVLLLLSSAGIIVFLHDITRQITEHIVLDQVLQNIYHPQKGWIAWLWGTFLVGPGIMYGLPTTVEQRVRLLQSTLQCPLPVARAILNEPGGIQRILDENYGTIDDDDYDDDITTTTTFDPKQQQQQQHSTGTGENETTQQNDEACLESVSKGPTIIPRTTTPLTEFRSIFYEIVRREIQNYQFTQSSRTTLQIVGATTAMALFSQLRYSPRARSIVWNVVHGTATVTFTTLMAGALGTLYAQHQQQSHETTDPSNALTSGIMETILGMIRRMTPFRKTCLAFLVMAYIRLRQKTGRQQ